MHAVIVPCRQLYFFSFVIIFPGLPACVTIFPAELYLISPCAASVTRRTFGYWYYWPLYVIPLHCTTSCFSPEKLCALKNSEFHSTDVFRSHTLRQGCKAKAFDPYRLEGHGQNLLHKPILGTS